MLKKTITYEDWNGKTRTEDFYFNLTRVECAELEHGLGPGKTLSGSFQTLMDNNDIGVVNETLKKLLLTAYGIKSEDGRRFIKNDEVREAFEQNPAFDQIYMELASNAEYAADFLTAIMPSAITEALGPDPKKELLDRANNAVESGNLNIV